MQSREQFVAHWRAQVDGAPKEFGQADLEAIDPLDSMRRRVAIVSMGNRSEAHSSAIAHDIDDRIGIHVAARVADQTGARYLGHCPFASDRLEGLAQAWSPACLPVEDFVAATQAYLQQLLSLHPGSTQLWIFSGHGGNAVLVPRLEAMRAALGLGTLHYELALRVPPPLAEWSTQHAGDLEHSVAAALGPGCFNRAAFDQLNERLAIDLPGVLRDEPAAGGMAGYYLLGDHRFDSVRARYEGIKPSVREFVERRRLVADPVRGAAVLEFTVRQLAAEVKVTARA